MQRKVTASIVLIIYIHCVLMSLPLPPACGRTCFYALCLISRTLRGADLLEELGWFPVRQLTTTSKVTTKSASSAITPIQSPSEAREAFPPQALPTQPTITVEAGIDNPPFERTRPVSQTGLVPPGRSAVLRQRSADMVLQPTKKRMSLSFSGLKEAVAPALSAPVVIATGQMGAVDDLHVHSGTPASNGGVAYEDTQLAGLERELVKSNPYGTLSRSALAKLRSALRIVSGHAEGSCTLGHE